MVYYKLLGKEVEAKAFDQFCTYYYKDADGNEWTIKGEQQRWAGHERQRWVARFEGNSVTADSMALCAELIQNRSPAKIQVRVTCDTGKTWVTTINGDLEGARAYFMGALFTEEGHPYIGVQTDHLVTRVEPL